MLALILISTALAGAPLEGGWRAVRHFGPDVRGPLELTRDPGGAWRAQIAGFDVAAAAKDGSINPHLLGAVLAKASGRPVLDLFQDLVAEPLQLRRYHVGLQLTGAPYLGGGAKFLPRDFMKLGQLELDGGVWNGRRVL